MTKSLNFVIATPTKIGRTKVGLNLGQAFSALGHQVTYFDYDIKPPLERYLPRALRAKGWQQRQEQYINDQLINVIKQQKPDLFLCVKGVQLFPETIQQINALGVTTIGYWIDDPLDHKRSIINAPFYHYYFTNDASSVALYKTEGVTRIQHLPSAADTHTFYPLPHSTSLADIIFVGTHSPYRESIVQQLQDFDLRVYGPGWHKAQLRKSCVYPEAFGKKTNEIFNQTKINLNIHNWFGQGSAMNLRLFEVPAAGGFLLTDWVAEIDDAYTEDKHIACWRNVEELRTKINYFLAHEEERQLIAKQGNQYFLQHHSYIARAQLMLSYLS
ncbi:CgeB family protein [Sulfurirhabdus autotrophica]|uniref:Spore maturation protein CgeB n=1 Tax=Sulfurirhabdus autotrophica TaxID=1706046 RepID=A0A4R3Y205_9PROT|nr:glycosyltransferase [Sulfurirhabdus autotrophica]TCV84284.1 spore maturation protein CgeB [Sulfurirhabdus autotrophica]